MNENFYNLEYLPKMHRIGKVIGVLAVCASFMPALILGLVYGLWPDWAALGTAALTAVTSFGILWFVRNAVGMFLSASAGGVRAEAAAAC